MRTFIAICRQHLREQRLATLVWVGVLAFMAYGIVSTAPSMAQNNTVVKFAETLPKSIQRLLGDMLLYKYPADVFINAKLLSFMPLLAAIFAVLSAMGIVAREVNHRTADFLMTLPVPRPKLLLSRFMSVACNVALLYGATYLILWAGLRLEGLDASFGGYAMYFVGHYVLTMLMASIALAVSLWVDDYARANRIALIITVSLFILNYANLAAQGPAWLGRIVVFGWVDSAAVVGKGLFPWSALVFGVLANALVLGLCVRSFERKQIPA